MNEIVFSLFIYLILIFISLILVGWYFKFMLQVIFRRKLSSIDSLVENGRLGPKRSWHLDLKLDEQRRKPFYIKALLLSQRMYTVYRINGLIRFVEGNEFMTQVDKDTYSAELKDVREDWQKAK